MDSIKSKIMFRVIFVLLIGITIYAIYNYNVDSYESSWQTYENEQKNFQISYPKDKIILIENSDNSIQMINKVEYTHSYTSDSNDETFNVEELCDFNIKLEVVNKNLIDTIRLNEEESFIEEYLYGNSLKVVPGYIEKIRINNFLGYSIFYEEIGSNEYKYYFVINAQRTLVVYRSIITEVQVLQDTPDPKEEEELFNNIISTFNILYKDVITI